jgi:hypothetical protein
MSRQRMQRIESSLLSALMSVHPVHLQFGGADFDEARPQHTHASSVETFTSVHEVLTGVRSAWSSTRRVRV